jgi:NADH-quinone oxidoreductase subunit F/NADP-reducing hydrogenase subunit HndC
MLAKEAYSGYSKTQSTIFVCHGTGCTSGKSVEIRRALEKEVGELGLDKVMVDFTGCHGFCEQGPIIVVEPEGIFYTRVSVEDVPEIAQSHLRDGQPVERLFYRDPVSRQAVPYYQDINFYKKQHRLILRNCGHINPERIEDYIAMGGYQSLRKVLFEMTPEWCWLPNRSQVGILSQVPGQGEVSYL